MDTDLNLVFGRFGAVVSARGASLRRFFEPGAVEGARDLIWGYAGNEGKRGGQGDVLMPFPSRIKGGRYSFAGRALQLALNDKDGPHAIHGFARALDWQGERFAGKAGARFRLRLGPEVSPGYPFSLELEVEYELQPDGLRCAFSARNVGPGPAPFGAGFHPYFRVGGGSIDNWEARIPAAKVVEFESLIPTGRLLAAEADGSDFRDWRRIGETRFNRCYAELVPDADGVPRAGLRDPASGRTILIECPAPFRYLVVYSGDALGTEDARRSLAIEPMTCATDAFNHPEWGLEILTPGQVLRGEYRVRVSK